MAGTAINAIRTASVAETTHGTTPATPGFVTTADPILMTAKTEPYIAQSLAFKGTASAIGVNSIPVAGTMSGPFVYGNFDDWLASLMQGAWASDVLVNGLTRSTRTVENTIPAGDGGTSTYLRYRGVEATGGKITLESNKQAEYSFDLTGMGSDASTTTAITGATYADPSNVIPMESGLDVGTITMAGYSPGGIQSAEIDFAFDLRDPMEVIGSYDTDGTALGAFLPKITISALIDASFAAIYDAARTTHSTFAVTFPLGSVSGNKYTIAFANCSFGAADVDLSGNNPIQQIEIIPQNDGSSSTVVTITRAVA